MALQLAPKSTASTVDRTVDWTAALAGDVIETATVVVQSGTVTISNVVWDGQRVTFTIAGGADGETATFLNTITTAGSQILDQQLSIYVETAIGPYGVTSSTKATVMEMAYEEIASAGYEFDHGPDENASTLRKLDALMLTDPYAALGYNQPAVVGQSDQLDMSGIPDSAIQTVAVALAQRISPSWGKSMSAESRASFARGVNQIRTMVSIIPRAQLRRNSPIGSGNRYRSTYWPYAAGYVTYVGA